MYQQSIGGRTWLLWLAMIRTARTTWTSSTRLSSQSTTPRTVTATRMSAPDLSARLSPDGIHSSGMFRFDAVPTLDTS